jgi:hypothetical protein
MKKFLLLMMCIPAALSAQAPGGNGVTVSNLSVNSGTVTFDVDWDKTAMPQGMVWSDTVWVFVDYNDAGVMRRLPLLPGATLTVTSAPAGVGKVMEVSGNDRGVRVVGNARNAGSFSATVQLLTATANFSGACVYASNYPPVGEYTTVTNILFSGTSPYELVLQHETGSTVTDLSGGNNYYVPANYTVQSFTDKTGAPGEFKCITPTAQTLAASAPGFCSGSSGVQFSLSGTQSGVKYWLYRNGAAIGTVLLGSGNADAFSGTYTAGSYTARSVKAGAFCDAAMDGTALVNAIPMPVTPKIDVSASTVCQNTAVTFTVSSPIAGVSYIWSGTPAGVASGAGNATYTVDASANAKSASVYARVTSGDITCQSANAATVSVSLVTPAVPEVTQGAFCLGLPGQLQATAPSGANVAWYDAPADGSLLANGNVLPLPPLCNVSTLYYAEARTANNCVSSRIQANYTVNHCVFNGSCPCFESGDIGSNVPLAVCSALDPGQIGSAVTPVACRAFDAGQIGSPRAPAACVSFSAGWIGNTN